jgi:hypothetical protein
MLGNYGSGLLFFHIKKKKGKVTELGLLKASLAEIGDQIKNEDQKSTQTEKGGPVHAKVNK